MSDIYLSPQSGQTSKTYNVTSNWNMSEILKTAIALCPVSAYRESTEAIMDNMILLPVSPSEIMFTEDTSPQTLSLMNGGDVSVSLNKKLATWQVNSFFPYRFRNGYKHWFDVSAQIGQQDKNPYDFYCAKLLAWEKNQTPLIFMYQTWGNFYACQIKTFKFGNKDSTWNVYYELSFQEYRETEPMRMANLVNTNYSGDTYVVQKGDTVLTIARKTRGNSKYFDEILKINGKDSPIVREGETIRIR